MTLTEKILLIAAGVILLAIILWGVAVRNLLKKLKKKVKAAYKDLRTELDDLYEFADRAAEKIAASGGDTDRILSIKGEAMAKKAKDIESRAECDAILQSRLKNAISQMGDNEELKKEYADIEIDIINVRKKYNAAVREYNCQRKMFPDRIISAILRYKPFGFYTADEADAD